MVWRSESDVPEDLHEQLMTATYRALCERGYADLTVRDIGEEFDKSRSLIHYHYGSKEALVLAFIEHFIATYGEELDVESGDPRERLEAFVDRFLFGPPESEFDHWDVFRVQYELRAKACRDPDVRKPLETGYRRMEDALASIIADGIDEGVFRAVDPYRTAGLILGVIDAARGQRIVFGRKEAPAEMREALSDLVLPSLYVDSPRSR